MNTPKLIKGLRMPWALTTTSRRTQRSRAKQQHLNAEHGAALATEDALAAKRRAGKKKRTNDAQSKAAVQWHCERKSPRASHLGYYDPAAPGVLSSTRQMEFSHMAIASPPTSHRGLAFGIDAGSGWMVVHDPFTSYGNELESPNVCFIGDLGQGKSSGIKTWAVLRQLLLGRRVVVIDKKYQLDQNGGEYTSLAQRLGITPVKFMVGGGGARINILDPRIAARLNEDSHDDTALSTPAGQSMLVRAVVEEALGRPLLP